MSRDDIQKLLGGYATGTLTPEEQEALFAAALDDQELFDALAREQSLRDLLRDPAAKAQLLTSLSEKPKAGWMSWWRPAAIGLAMTALTVVVVRQIPTTPQPESVAMVKTQPPASVGQPAAAPVPTAEPRPIAKEKEKAPAQERTQEKLRAKKSAANQMDQLAKVRKDQTAAAPLAGVSGGAPPAAQPAPPPPPAKREEAPTTPPDAAARDATVPSVDLAAPKVAAASGAMRARQSARAMFLLRAPVVEAMKSNYVEQLAQGQMRQQSPTPPAQQQQSGARESVRVMAESKMLTQAPQPGVRYTVAGGALRLETNDYGYLYVLARGPAGAWRSLLSGSVEPSQQRVTTLLRPDEKEVFVSFSRSVEVMKGGPAPPQPWDDPSTNLVEQDGDAVYVVNPLQGSAGRQVSFTIRLP